MRILQVITHYELGGAEKCAFEITQLIGGFYEMGIVAVLGDDSSVVGKGLTQEAREIGVRIYNGINFPWKFGGFLIAAFRLNSIIKKFRPDIIHLNTEVPEFTYALCLSLFPSLRSITVIRTIHNTNLWPRWKRLGIWTEKILNNYAVIYVSEAVQDSFHDWRDECSLNRVSNESVIYNPITVPKIQHKFRDQKRKRKKVKLLFAGRFEHQKGCDLLPEIVSKIKVPKDTQVSLHVFGEGVLKSTLDNLVTSPPHGWEVYVNPPKLNLVDELSKYDGMLFPSRYEGYGRLAAEAVLVGIPVVAFRLKVLLEIFPHNYPWLARFDNEEVDGFADHVSALIKSRNEIPLIVDRARAELIDKLDPNKIAKDYIECYEDLCCEPTS